jgi:acyl carrier protein
MDELIAELKEQIVEQLKLKNITPADIGDEAPLFGAGLGLDSLDILELIVLLKQKYKLRVGDPEEGKKVFTSVKTMAEYITANRV